MADTYITYNANAVISHQEETYPYSAILNHSNRHLDIYGRRTDDSSAQDVIVRSYYTVSGIDSKTVDGIPLAIQELVTLVTVKRANMLEQEINPMSTIINRRNAKIKNLNILLAAVVKTQTQIEAQEAGDNDDFACKGLGYYLLLYFTDAELSDARLKDFAHDHSDIKDECKSKRTDGYVASANQLIKAKIDTLNNEARSDLSRIDNLVSKRDEAYTQSTDLMSKFSRGFDSTIKNFR